MRSLYLSDLHAAACILRLYPASEHRALIMQGLADAAIADRYRKRLGKPHPLYGTGTLTSALARFFPLEEPKSCDLAYLFALQTTVQSILATRPDPATLH